MSSRQVGRNIVWNAAGQILMLAVSISTMPYIVRRMGASAYGIWAFVTGLGSYFGILELGVGAAATKYVAEYAAREDKGAIERTIANALSLYLFLAC